MELGTYCRYSTYVYSSSYRALYDDVTYVYGRLKIYCSMLSDAKEHFVLGSQIEYIEICDL